MGKSYQAPRICATYRLAILYGLGSITASFAYQRLGPFCPLPRSLEAGAISALRELDQEIKQRGKEQ